MENTSLQCVNMNRSESLLTENDHINQTDNDQSETDESIFSTDTSQLSEQENSFMEDGVDDKFNGIFYNVNHEDNRVLVLFSTIELFSKFVTNLRKEFADHKSTYITHVHGQKCFINIHKEEKGLSITGPGCRIWRETTFLRLATNLYRQYETDTNKHIEETRQQTASVSSQSSTPNINRSQLNPETPWSPVMSENPSSRKLESISEMQSDIKGQVSSLMEMIISLQEQVDLLSSKLENKGVVSDQDNHSNKSESNSSNDQSVIIQSVSENATAEPQHVNDELSIVPGQKSYSWAVKKTTVHNETPNQSDQSHKRTKEHEVVQKTTYNNNMHTSLHNQQGNNNAQSKQAPLSRNSTVKTLLIGDSLLSGVNKKGLRNNVYCQPIPGANINTIMEKIELFDLTKFGNIIIYVGGNDASRINDMEQFETQYKKLISLIRGKNQDCKIYLCGSCPRGDADVSIINKVIDNIAQEYRLRFIDTYTPFYDKNEDLRTRFYGKRDWIHLSNSGIKRLLGTIHDVTAIVENFNSCIFPTQSEKKYHSQNYPRRPNKQSSDHKTTKYPDSRYQDGDSRGRNYSNYYNGWNSETEHHYGHNGDRDYSSDEYYSRVTPVERCAKCGLTNHSTAECRHRRQILCYECHMYGHKDSVCWNI